MKRVLAGLAAAALLSISGSLAASNAFASNSAHGKSYGCTIHPSACVHVVPTPFTPPQLPPTGGASNPQKNAASDNWPLYAALGLPGLLGTAAAMRKLVFRRS